jgi:Mg/Co/Ni transporter MgtE
LTLNSGKLPIFLAVNERELKNILENVNPEIAESILFQQTEFRIEEILKHLEPKKSEQLRTMLENKEMSGS